MVTNGNSRILNIQGHSNEGCYITQTIDENIIRIHTFGGREIGVDIRGNDLGWTQNPHDLAKFPRNMDVVLGKVSNKLSVLSTINF